MDSLVEANKWRSAFREVAAIVALGAHASGAREPDIPVVVEAVQRLKRHAQLMGEELRELRRKEAALQVSLGGKGQDGGKPESSQAMGWPSGLLLIGDEEF